jgi:hypothetical protein
MRESRALPDGLAQDTVQNDRFSDAPGLEFRAGYCLTGEQRQGGQAEAQDKKPWGWTHETSSAKYAPYYVLDAQKVEGLWPNTGRIPEIRPLLRVQAPTGAVDGYHG